MRLQLQSDFRATSEQRSASAFSVSTWSRTALLASWLTAVLSSAATSADKLNPPLIEGGDITVHRVTPDGSRIVYRADQDTDEVFELYTIPVSGGPATKLNGPLVDGGNVHSVFEITPDGDQVVYLADQEMDERLEIYSVPVDGSMEPVKLNGTMVAGGSVNPFDFGMTSDGSQIVYLADQEIDGQDEVFAARVDGGGPTIKLNGPLIDAGNVLSFEVSPNGDRVVYQANQDDEFRNEIYTRPIDGSGAAMKLNGPLVLGGDVDLFFQFTSDSSRLIYSADQDIDQITELYSVPADGSGMPVKINDPLAPHGRVSGYRITPDGTQIVYAAEQDTEARLELYIRPIDGSGTPRKLNGPLVDGADAFIDDVSSDGTHLVYLADHDQEDVFEAYSVPLDGSRGPVKLNGPPVEGGEVIGGIISFDNEHYIYFADLDTAGVVNIYSRPLDGSGENVRLSRPFDTGAFTVSLDSEFVAFLEGGFFGATGLFGVPLTGGMPFQLNDPLPLGGSIGGLHTIHPDSRTVTYLADQDAIGVVELYSASLISSLCDFNSDDECDVVDIDALIAAISSVNPDTGFDLNGDGQVDLQDRDIWLGDAAAENGKAEPYLLGDTNLDGSVTAIDLNNIALNWRSHVAAWSAGDFNGDRVVDPQDLNILALNWRGHIADLAAVALVPEPNAMWLGLVLIVIHYLRLR